MLDSLTIITSAICIISCFMYFEAQALGLDRLSIIMSS